MIIGVTYDLRQEYLDMGYSETETAEFDSVETVDALESALQVAGHSTVRIGNAFELTERLVKGERWDFVFNIAEGMRGVGREAQVPAILDLYGIAYTFSDPVVMGLTLHKGLTKRVIRDAGLATADFRVVIYPEDAGNIHFDPPYFIKPVAEGTGKGITAGSVVGKDGDIRAEDLVGELTVRCSELFAEFGQPVLVEKFLPGREFTVGLWGTGKDARVIGTMEIAVLQQGENGIYSFENKEGWKGRVIYRPMLPEGGEIPSGWSSSLDENLINSAQFPPCADPVVDEVERLALDSWRVLECRDAGRIDIRCDENGKPCFMEVNPLAGLRPGYSDLPILCSFFGVSYQELIEKIVESASLRIAGSYRNRASAGVAA